MTHTEAHTDPLLVNLAARASDDNLVRLMWMVVERGQKASRKGDTEGAANFQRAYDIYHAEVVRRGLGS